MGGVTTYVGATEAARMLGVSKPTLYAYVSRGMLRRETAVDGRTSLYAREDVERLASRGRRRQAPERPTIDVQVTSSITHLHDERVTYRGHDVARLAASCAYEQVAELLLTGTLPASTEPWRVDRGGLERCRAVTDAAGARDPVTVLSLAAATLADLRPDDDAATAARTLLAVIPTLLGGPLRGDFADRLTRAWVRRPAPELVTAISRALVLLADHELATSTLAVRVACSVRADPYSAIGAGLAVVRGPYHGAANRAVTGLLDRAEQIGAGRAVAERLERGERLPGFGHSVYRRGDPRFEPLLDSVRTLPRSERVGVVDAVLAEAGRSVGQLPNVDLALGALIHVAGLAQDVPLFAIARISGWAAHYLEEQRERPVRYRGLARQPANVARV